MRIAADATWHCKHVGAENCVTASDQRLRFAGAGLVVTSHGQNCMIVRCGLATRLPDAHARAGLAGTARSIRCSEGQLGEPALAVADDQIGQRLLVLDHLVDLLLQGAVHTNLRTCTLRRCPMRNARSVAWFSTAGFHHRSRWMTWLAAVRLRPVPPAFNDSRKIGGPCSDWKRSTISSRCFLAVLPCR